MPVIMQFVLFLVLCAGSDGGVTRRRCRCAHIRGKKSAPPAAFFRLRQDNQSTK